VKLGLVKKRAAESYTSRSDREASDKEANYETVKPKRACAYPKPKRCWWINPKPRSKSVELLNPLRSHHLNSTETGRLLLWKL